jgi:RNA polymerase sigma factor (sigma-70 family)
MSTNSITDRELLERIAKYNDTEASRIFFERYAADVRDAIEKVVPVSSRIDSDDVCQEVFLKVLNSPRKFIKASGSPTKLVAYLKETGRNRLLDMNRKKLDQMSDSSNEMESLGHELGCPPPPSPFDVKVLVDALDVLGQKDRQLVKDHYVGSKSYHELASLYGEPSPESVRKRIARALEKVRRHLTLKGITGTAFADEVRILTLPSPIWVGSLSRSTEPPQLHRCRLWLPAAAIVLIGILLCHRIVAPPGFSGIASDQDLGKSQTNAKLLQAVELVEGPNRGAMASPANQWFPKNAKELRAGSTVVHDRGKPITFKIQNVVFVDAAFSIKLPSNGLFKVTQVFGELDQALPGEPLHTVDVGGEVEGEPITGEWLRTKLANPCTTLMCVGRSQIELVESAACSNEAGSIVAIPRPRPPQNPYFSPPNSGPATEQSEGGSNGYESLVVDRFRRNWSSVSDCRIFKV